MDATTERRVVSGGAIAMIVLAAVSALGMVLAARTDATVASVRLGIVATALGLGAFILAMRARDLASWRILGDPRRARLLEALIRMPTMPVVVSAPAADEEARAYAGQILRVLKEAGFPARGVPTQAAPPDLEGADALLLVGHPGERPTGADDLFRALARGGIRAVIHESPGMPRNTFELFVVPRRPR